MTTPTGSDGAGGPDAGDASVGGAEPQASAPQPPGQAIVTTDAVGTVALGAVTLAAAVADGSAVSVAGLVVAGLLFVGGCGAFAVGFARAAGRSRYEVVDLAGLFYLTGSAPTVVRRWMLGLWYIQIAIAVAAVAVARPPFAVMAPVWGIGLLTLWGALYGTFEPRPPQRRR